MALGATRAPLRRRQTLPRKSTDGWEGPESHDAVSFLTQTSPVTSHHQETSFLGEGTRDNELSDKEKSPPAKFVLKIKYLADGSLDKYKARLVALGYMARAGVDVFVTWSPMASLTAIRLIFSIAVHYNTCILHADVPNAF